MRRHGLAPTLLALLALCVSLAPAVAQTADSLLGPLRSAVAATKPMTRVRVELRDGRQLTGALGPIRYDAIEVTDPSGTRMDLRYADVTRYWRRGRATRTGAIVGAIPATIFGVLLGVAASGMCETPGCGDNPVATAAGVGLFVGALGAGAGALIGAAFPKWREAWTLGASAPRADQPLVTPVVVAAPRDSATATATAAPPTRAGRIGEVTALLTAGYAGFGATSQRPADGGPIIGGSLGLGFRLGRVGFGPETSLQVGTVGSVWSIAGIGRVDLRDRRSGGRVPYLVAGVGGNIWSLKGVQGDESTGLFTGTLGVGTTIGGRWRIEGRWNPVLQYSDPDVVHPTLITLGVGRLLAW